MCRKQIGPNVVLVQLNRTHNGRYSTDCGYPALCPEFVEQYFSYMAWHSDITVQFSIHGTDGFLPITIRKFPDDRLHWKAGLFPYHRSWFFRWLRRKYGNRKKFKPMYPEMETILNELLEVRELKNCCCTTIYMHINCEL